MKVVSDINCKDNKEKHFVFNTSFKKGAVCEMMWKNVVEPARPQMKIRRMRIACWVSEATNTPSEYVLLIGLSLQQWLHESASMLHYTYIVSCYTTAAYDCNQSFALVQGI
jgi:formamidopyrimidine-DNA glycosylase